MKISKVSFSKVIKNRLNGHHLNSKYWQDIKNRRPNLDLSLYNIAVGMLLGDATMYKVSKMP